MYIFIWAESFIILESGSLLYICIRVEVLTNLSLSSAPPTITMLLSALSFSLKSSMPSMEHCSVFWPTTNNTGVFMSKSGSSTSCKPVSCVSSMALLWQEAVKQRVPTPLGPFAVRRGKLRQTTAVKYSIRDTWKKSEKHSFSFFFFFFFRNILQLLHCLFKWN